MAIRAQSTKESYADITNDTDTESLRCIVSVELSDTELQTMGSELIEFFEALGEVNEMLEEQADA